MKQVLNLTYNKLYLSSASEEYVTINNGKRLIDLTSGWNVVNAGWNNKTIIEAIEKHLHNHSLYCPSWLNNTFLEEFHTLINNQLDFEYSLIKCVSGSESVEAAIKIARRINNRKVCVGFENVYHGWTMGASLVGGIERNKDHITSGKDFVHLPFPDHSIDIVDFEMESIRFLKEVKPAAIIIESIFTNPGGFSLRPEFIKALSNVCKEENILIICDEVGTGFGRTGHFFGFEYYPNFSPDIICLSKAITNGSIPMACVLLKSSLMSKTNISTTGMFNTYGCTPLACTAAISTMNFILSNNLSDRSNELGLIGLNFLNEELDDLEHVGVQGRGLFISIVLSKPVEPFEYISYSEVKEIKNKLLEQNILIESSDYCNALLIMPPLIIKKSNYLKALSLIVKAVKSHFN